MPRAALLLCLSSLSLACLDARDRSGEGGQLRSAVLCGLPSVDAPATRPIDACRDGLPVFGPHRFERDRGRPRVESLAFHTDAEVQGCLAVRSGGAGHHGVPTGWIELDGERVLGSDCSDRHAVALERHVALPAGDHVVTARLRGKPGSWVEVSVFTGGDGPRHAPVSSEHLELYDLYADPPTFRGDVEPTRLTASGAVRDLPGSPSGKDRHLVRWRFEILGVGSCALVRTLAGETPLGDARSFAPDALWDGLDAGGAEAPGGEYAYRVIADLVRTSHSGETVVDTLATALQTLTLQRLGGYVDFHTHPLSHLGFGEKAMHGAPDTDAIVPAGNLACNASPFRASTIDEALGSCNGTHGGWGLFDNTCGDHLRAAIINLAIDGDFAFKTTNLHGDHQHAGYPGLDFWPHQTSKLHQQMWWEWLRRAHEGGLGVIVALTVNNELLAEILNGTPPYDDRAVAERQIAETIRMVEHHGDFMEIARSSADLLRIAGEGKLAVVLGMEVDRIGNWDALDLPSEAAIRDELRHLHALGVRYVFPVHLVDNAFGGSAVYSPLFSFANKRANGYHYVVGTSDDPDVTFDLGRIEDIPISPGIGNATLGALHGLLVGLGELPAPCIDHISCLPPPGKLRCCGSFGEITDILRPSPELDVYGFIPPGHVNALGLSSRGEIAIDELMKLGMFIDLDHMSERTMTRVIQLAEQTRLVTGGDGYPLMLGHTGIRGAGDSERMPRLSLVQRVAALGGMAGAGSSDATPERFIEGYRRLAAVMGPDSVGIGTDVNGFERLPLNAEGCVLGADTTGSTAFYDRFLAESGLIGRSSTGTRTWDYVLDCGVAHYGLMPEFLFDVRAFHGGDDVNRGLMRSTLGLVRMWRQIEEVSAELE